MRAGAGAAAQFCMLMVVLGVGCVSRGGFEQEVSSVGDRLELIQAAPGTDLEVYAGAASCRECHSSIYDAWIHGPHARASNPSGPGHGADSGFCARCHSPASRGLVLDAQGRVIPRRGFECESCHRPLWAHVHRQEPVPREDCSLCRLRRECLRCHTRRTSPHFDFPRRLERVEIEHGLGTGWEAAVDSGGAGE